MVPAVSCLPFAEALECVRKVLLTGVLGVFDPGSDEQLTVGLVITIAFSWLYHNIKPYKSSYDDGLAQLCQGSLFFVFIGEIVLRGKTAAPEALDYTLCCVVAMPFVFAVVVAIIEAAKDRETQQFMQQRANSLAFGLSQRSLAFGLSQRTSSLPFYGKVSSSLGKSAGAVAEEDNCVRAEESSV